MNMALPFRLHQHALQSDLEFRQGFMDAIGSRVLTHLPPPRNPESIDNRPKAYQRGYWYGKGCALAIGEMPDVEGDEMDTEDQYSRAAYVSAALVVVSMVVLYVRSVGF